MTRVKWISLILLLAVAAYFGAVGVVWLTRPAPGVTEENARLLRKGMTLEQVEQLLGSPGDTAWLKDPPEFYWYFWCNDTLRVYAVFDDTDRLHSTYMSSGQSPFFTDED